jgi:hypothetical protein
MWTGLNGSGQTALGSCEHSNELVFITSVLTFKLTNSMDLSPSWEATSHSASEEFPNT